MITNQLNKIILIKKILIFLILLFSIQFSFAQKDAIELKNQVQLAYERGDYESAIERINEMEHVYKQMPFSYLSMRIKALYQIISNNPKTDFQNIVDCNKFISDYLKKAKASDQDVSYNEIVAINKVLESYPKDESSYIIYKEKNKEEARETEIRDSIVKIRTEKLKPYIKVVDLNTLRLGYISDDEFETVLNNVEDKYQEEVIEQENKEKLKAKRTDILQPYSNFVSYNDYLKLGDLSNDEFDQILKSAKKRAKPIPQLYSFSSLGFQSGTIAKYGLLYESSGVKAFGYRLALRSSLSSNDNIISGKVKKNKTEIEIGTNYNIYNGFYLNFGIGYGYYKKLLNNDFLGTISTENKGYFVTTTGIMYRLNNQFNVNCGIAFMDIHEDLYKPELTLGVTYNLINITKNQNKTYSTTPKNRAKNYYNSLPSFSSLGFQSGEISKYGLLYETGGRKKVGFHISARTTLRPEQIFSGEVIENKKEIELGPNFMMSDHIYLNVGIGYGNYNYFNQDAYQGGKIGYYIATTGIMYRISRVININSGLSFMDIDEDLHKTEITFGISFNLRGKYKY